MQKRKKTNKRQFLDPGVEKKRTLEPAIQNPIDTHFTPSEVKDFEIYQWEKWGEIEDLAWGEYSQEPLTPPIDWTPPFRQAQTPPHLWLNPVGLTAEG
jgi:hypothetical protein